MNAELGGVKKRNDRRRRARGPVRAAHWACLAASTVAAGGTSKVIRMVLMRDPCFKTMIFWDVTPCSLLDKYQAKEELPISILRSVFYIVVHIPSEACETDRRLIGFSVLSFV